MIPCVIMVSYVQNHVGRVPFPYGFCEYWLDMVGIGMAFFIYKIFLPNKYYSMCEHGITPPNYC